MSGATPTSRSAYRRSRPQRRGFGLWLRALVAGSLTAVLVGGGVGLVGSQLAVTTATAATEDSSAKTLTAQDALDPTGTPFPDLKVTVSKTSGLTNEGLRVSYSGGSLSSTTRNYLQIAQCWGTVIENGVPGPARETCVFGAIAGDGGLRATSTTATDVATKDRPYTSFQFGAYTSVPFVAYNEALVTDPALVPQEYLVSNLTKNPQGDVVTRTEAGLTPVNVNQNRYFTKFTTNEIAWAPFSDDGTGEVVFEAQTALESSGLGCGSPIGLGTNAVTGQSCWLVVIPRGTADNGANAALYPGIWWDSWRHRIAFKLDFDPVGSRCSLSSGELQVQGSPLLSEAMFSWQGAYCGTQGGRAIAYSRGTDQDAALASATTSGAPLALVSRPLAQAGVTDTMVYAPLALTGVTISFSVDRFVNVTASEEEQKKSRTPFTSMKLTPRLLAKLLTDSYLESIDKSVPAADMSGLDYSTSPATVVYPTDSDGDRIPYLRNPTTGRLNPTNITRDPEFLAINPEWKNNILLGVGIASAVTPIGRADAVRAVWDYILADAEAKDWLAGKPDEDGMVVNPFYAISDDANALGAALALPTDSFPKADPWELPNTFDPATKSGSIAMNQIDYRPYADSFEQSAQYVLRGDDRTLGGFDNNSTPPKWVRDAPAPVGQRTAIGVTDASAAARFETYTALLLNPAGEYVGATTDGMLAAASVMTEVAGGKGVRSFDNTADGAKAATAAYPLTMPIYAAMNPVDPDKASRGDYASLVEFIVTKGQRPGQSSGDLPRGYAPLPAAWVTQATSAAATARQGVTSTPTPTPSTSIPTVTTSSGAASYVTPVYAVPTAQGDGGTAAPAAETPITVAQLGATPDDPDTEPLAAAVPIGLAAGLVAALAVPLVSRVRRPL
ncbi:hypothetical protein [Microbacterium sp.]|uniref:hypothetical protein n=1 Tax=Microbacterium sp. TaxID=51671 RepID=UPI002636663A|nr:hypothetical protein [Microbacterium sp.]